MADSHLNLYPHDLVTQMAIGNTKVQWKKKNLFWATRRVKLTYTLLGLTSSGRSLPLGRSPRPIYNKRRSQQPLQVIPKGEYFKGSKSCRHTHFKSLCQERGGNILDLNLQINIIPEHYSWICSIVITAFCERTPICQVIWNDNKSSFIHHRSWFIRCLLVLVTDSLHFLFF